MDFSEQDVMITERDGCNDISCEQEYEEDIEEEDDTQNTAETHRVYKFWKSVNYWLTPTRAQKKQDSTLFVWFVMLVYADIAGLAIQLLALETK